MTLNEKDIYNQLVAIYGEKVAKTCLPELIQKIDNFNHKNQPGIKTDKLSHIDTVLIMYADQVMDDHDPPLEVVRRFLGDYVYGLINGIHLLPFFTSSSDEGFSVVDYYQVNPKLGTWEDIERLKTKYKLMFDAVINHVSSHSHWFKAFLRGENPYQDYFITITPDADLSNVTRPRDLPLLTKFNTDSGEKYLWTTFSKDQIDINYKNPDVLFEIIDIILFYVEKGAEYIRLDAIAYAFKEVGTKCIHLAKTHRLVELINLILDSASPNSLIITETNVPHIENISYFGDGTNESQLVYNFALPPLVLHGILTGNARKISKWASKLDLPSQCTTFFNFLASHDGIGLNPARGILDDKDIDYLVSHIKSVGGYISYKSNPDGSRSPYELNINYYDALSDPGDGLTETQQTDRFILAHAVMFSLIGLPGIYFHSMFGSRGWAEGVQNSGENRAINRERLSYSTLIGELSNPNHRRYRIYHRLAQLLKIRAASSGFHPFGHLSVIDIDGRIFAFERTDPEGKNRIFCLHNFSCENIEIEVQFNKSLGQNAKRYIDLISHHHLVPGEDARLVFKPYQFYWLSIV